MDKKSFMQQRSELATGRAHKEAKVEREQPVTPDSTPENSGEKFDNNAGGNKFQMDEQDKIQLRNYIATGVEEKLNFCLPPLIKQCLSEVEDKQVDDKEAKPQEKNVEVIKDYYRETSENHSTVVALATAMDDRSQRDLESREENNRLLRKMRTNQNTALNAGKRFGKQLRADIHSDIDHALNQGKPSKPELREGCSFPELMKYTLWQVPKYYILCFLNDRHTKAFFRSTIACVFVILLSLIGFMAHDLAKYRVEAEKYHLLRDWVNVDSTRATDKCLYLDGLFEDRDNNEEYIQRLCIGIRNERMLKGRSFGGHE